MFLISRYITALTEDTDNPNLQTAVGLGWPASLHLIGKVSDFIAFNRIFHLAVIITILS